MCYKPQKLPENRKMKSFDNTPQTMYRGSWALEIVSGPPNQCAIAQENSQKMQKTKNFDDFPKTVYRGSQNVEIISGPQNSVAMNTARKCKTEDFLRRP
jgi:hypothetical protein